MLAAVAILYLALALSASAQNVTLADVQQAFVTFKVVPDVLASFSPQALLDVVFTDPATQHPLNVTPGLNLTMEQTTNEPQFSLTFNETGFDNETFVLAIVDPDAPTPQNTSVSQFRHMLAGDFHLNGTDGNGTLLVNSSAALTDFVNPTPPAGSDPHRYVVLLFNQPSNFSTVAPQFVNASTVRTNFNLSTFGAEVGLGSPVAGTFFLTGPDNSTTSASGMSSAAGSSPTSPAGGTSGGVKNEVLIGNLLAGLLIVKGLAFSSGLFERI